MARIAFDLDNTLASQGTPAKNYKDSFMYPDMINLVNDLYSKNHEIYVFTARHFKYFEYTNTFLKESGLDFTGLVMNKINCDLFVDDKGFRWEKGKNKCLLALIEDL